MRKFLIPAALFWSAATASALVQPMAINFQGKLVNPTTNAPVTGTAQLTFKLYNVSSGGAALWTEGPDGVVVTNGVFALTIGTNTALSRELFLGASSYLEVTVNSVNGVADGTAMTPRQRLLMSPYAFTANQLSDQNDVRLIAGPTYSTFTSAGNLLVPYGIAAASATLTGGLTASSGTFLAAGAAQYSLVTSSGIQMNAGTLDVNGGGGITNSYGLTTGSMTVTDARLTVGGSSFTVVGGSATVAYSMTAKQFVASSSATASSFFGDGSNLTGLGTLNNVWYYTATGGTTWNYANAVSSGVTSIYVEAIGGGGGGGGAKATGTTAACGGGGGGGGYAGKRLVLGVDVTANQTATAGSAGTAGATTPTAGGNGGNSSFGSLVVAGFGVGGSTLAASATVPGSNVGGAGGSGTTGDLLLSAGDGGRCFRISITHVWGGQGGGGARGSGVTPGAWVGAAGTMAGTAGNQYGGGGGGAAGASNTTGVAGGAGAQGIVIVWEFK